MTEDKTGWHFYLYTADSIGGNSLGTEEACEDKVLRVECRSHSAPSEDALDVRRTTAPIPGSVCRWTNCTGFRPDSRQVLKFLSNSTDTVFRKSCNLW